MRNKKTAGRPNNYIYNYYFIKSINNENNNKKNISNKHINNGFTDNCCSTYPDFTLSIKKNADHYTLHDILTSIGFKSIRNRKLEKGNYQRKWSFMNHDNGITAEAFYCSKALCFPSLLLKINDPNKEVVNQLNQIFISRDIHPNLSFVELTFDFFTNDVVRLRDFIESFTFMKNARTEPRRYRGTYYLNDLRKSERGMRIYNRREWGKVRMEVTLKSQILKRLGVSFPFDLIDSLDLSKFFLFKEIDGTSAKIFILVK